MGEDLELIMILGSIGVISVFGYLIINMVLNLTAVEVNEKAKLIGKDTENASHINGDSLMTTTTYVLTFEADGGERITFRVGRGVYRKYFIGDYGRLTYKRKWFRQFERI
ncbi:DUF2500 family protein [Trichococcus sp. K1Tr]|uniref:DUF2500 family protein n=1 Tax=Trichococcus sp. K1Tr TaxID=3020847 RepID=UPI00232B3DFC|nr:DUF2500 family protein [Trichococcus sp. K1Tr]MDB6354626.1 DUF2500 family protein [Trichococcus sp. K1Tr]